MCPCSAAVSPAIAVLIADSNRMQAQLLTSALRRRSEFRIATCQVDIASILQAVTSSPAKVVVLSLNHSVNIASQMAAMRRVHLSHPAVAKVLLVESYDRELVVSAFRSGARGIFCISDTHFRPVSYTHLVVSSCTGVNPSAVIAALAWRICCSTSCTRRVSGSNLVSN